MTGMFRRLVGRAHARRKALAAWAMVLASAGAGGWIAAAPPEPVRLTAHALPASRPAAPATLQAELEELAARFREPIGIAVVDVADGWTAQVDGEARYPQQSVSKLWVALSVLKAVDEGRLALDQTQVMTPEDRSVF
ncbi:MAG: serine hydrolase, partial [Phenylobacterium sp.]